MGNNNSYALVVAQNELLMQILTQTKTTNGDGNTDGDTGSIVFHDNSETKIDTLYEKEVVINNFNKEAGQSTQVPATDLHGSGDMPKYEAFTQSSQTIMFENLARDFGIDWKQPILPEGPATINILICAVVGLALALTAVASAWFTLSRRHRQQRDELYVFKI
jgi:hypothetical protein